jgi:ABC-2 type transport system ATP-binding protein
VARLAVTSGWGLLELKAISMTLEDVFLQLTRDEEGFTQNTVAAAPEPAVHPA